MHLRTLLRVALLATLLASAAVQAKDFAVVVHKASMSRNISVAEFDKLLKAAAWPDGKPMMLVVARLDSSDLKLVFQKLGTTPDGKSLGSRFLVLESDEAVVDMVARTPGAIGIVDVYSINGQITVVKLDGKLPLEAGYLLHR